MFIIINLNIYMNMSVDQIFDKVKDIVSNQLGIDGTTITQSASFTKDLGADSLDVVELVMAFEEEFEIDIDDQNAGEIETVEDAVNFIVSQVQK